MSSSRSADNPDAERRGVGWGRTSGPRPLPGIACPVLTRAIRQVETKVLREVARTEREHVAQLLAAVALAVGQRAPTFVVQLSPRHAPGLTRQVLDLLRTALLRAWSDATVPAPATRVLRHLLALEQLREALEADTAHEFGVRLAGPDGADFLAEVVHDLRSPLNSILFLAETLEQARSGPVTDLQRRQLRLIHIAALQLSSVASDAIELAQGGDPLRREEPTPFSVTRLLESVRDMVRPMAEEKNLEVRFIRPERDYRLGRELTLRRVLLNLLTNALKFTQVGSVDVTVVERGDTRVEFSVRDTGPGIPPAAEADLFRAFRRVPTERRQRFSSTGLGLAVSRRLVAALDGTLQHETAPEQGTRFWFETDLPPVPASEDPGERVDRDGNAEQ